MSTAQIEVFMDGQRARMSLSGRFDFSVHREFHDACLKPLQNPVVTEIEIDLGAVDYLDSSALGMLLLLREKASSANKTTSLTNCHGVVAQILDVVNFNKLFVIT
jgi:HptB-dependent secretion and biofilm anti anti-sigma factor